MLRNFTAALTVSLMALFPSVAAPATPEEANALLEEAIAYFHAHGAEETFAEISKPDGRFKRGELYIFVYDGEAYTVAHGADPGLVGKHRMNQQDVNGKYFTRDIMALGESGGSVDYAWMNYETGEIEQKTSYIMRAGEYRFGCGIYQN